MKYNLNYHVKVKLTPLGREIHRRDYEKLYGSLVDKYPYAEPNTDYDPPPLWVWNMICFDIQHRQHRFEDKIVEHTVH